jgi:hypothetical protein
MGIGLGSRSRDRYDDDRVCTRKKSNKLPNPDPTNYIITESLQIGNMLLVKIRYPDCTNYEGMKILVYEDMTIQALITQQKIDPHFSENKKYKSPLARFAPTDYGWVCAMMLAKHIKK